MAIIIDGKELAKKIRANLKIECEELKNKQKRYFQIIYNLILGTDNGPKMGLLLSAMPYDVILSKLQKPQVKKLGLQ